MLYTSDRLGQEHFVNLVAKTNKYGDMIALFTVLIHATSVNEQALVSGWFWVSVRTMIVRAFTYVCYVDMRNASD